MRWFVALTLVEELMASIDDDSTNNEQYLFKNNKVNINFDNMFKDVDCILTEMRSDPSCHRPDAFA